MKIDDIDVSKVVKNFEKSKNQIKNTMEELKTDVGNSFSIIGNEFLDVFTNSLAIDGNQDVIVQNLASAFTNLMLAINNIIQSDNFQEFLTNIINKIKDISEKISNINWQNISDALVSIGSSVGAIALEILNGLVDVLKWISENQVVAEIILSIATAIEILSVTIKAMSILSDLNINLIAIAAVIALIILAITNWENIMNFLKATIEIVVNSVVEFFTNLWNQTSFIFYAIYDVISAILGYIWDLFLVAFEAIWNIVSPIINAIFEVISVTFQAIWSIISSILESIWNIFSQVFNWVLQLVTVIFQGIWNVVSPMINKVWDVIKSVLSKIKEVWSNSWNSISGTVSEVWNGIWGAIKGVINLILSGMEKMVNGVIESINFILGGIDKVANAVGSVVGIDPINLKINYISLPRLAKGGVLTRATAFIGGEYAGANSNPEIVSPQSILMETFDTVLSNHEWNRENNTAPINVSLIVGNTKLGEILLEDLRSIKRQTGKNIEAICS